MGDPTTPTERGIRSAVTVSRRVRIAKESFRQLSEFINDRRETKVSDTRDDTTKSTHVSLTGGKYTILDDDSAKFHSLMGKIYEQILRNPHLIPTTLEDDRDYPMHLAEVGGMRRPFLIDLDMKATIPKSVPASDDRKITQIANPPHIYTDGYEALNRMIVEYETAILADPSDENVDRERAARPALFDADTRLRTLYTHIITFIQDVDRVVRDVCVEDTLPPANTEENTAAGELVYYVSEKPHYETVVGPRGEDMAKDGLHLMCPYLVATNRDLLLIRRRYLDKIADEPGVYTSGATLSALSGNRSMEQIYDEAVLAKNPWVLLGNKKGVKNSSQQYELAFKVIIGPGSVITRAEPMWDHEPTDFFWEERDLLRPIGSYEGLVRKFSIRNQCPGSAEFEVCKERLKDDPLYRSITRELLPDGKKCRQSETRLIPEDSLLDGVADFKQLVGKLEKRAGSNADYSSEEYSRLLEKLLLEDLPDKLAHEFSSWKMIGFALHKISPDLLDLYLRFSARSPRNYCEKSCKEHWARIIDATSPIRTNGLFYLVKMMKTTQPDYVFKVPLCHNRLCEEIVQANIAHFGANTIDAGFAVKLLEVSWELFMYGFPVKLTATNLDMLTQGGCLLKELSPTLTPLWKMYCKKIAQVDLADGEERVVPPLWHELPRYHTKHERVNWKVLTQLTYASDNQVDVDEEGRDRTIRQLQLQFTYVLCGFKSDDDSRLSSNHISQADKRMFRLIKDSIQCGTHNSDIFTTSIIDLALRNRTLWCDQTSTMMKYGRGHSPINNGKPEYWTVGEPGNGSTQSICKEIGHVKECYSEVLESVKVVMTECKTRIQNNVVDNALKNSEQWLTAPIILEPIELGRDAHTACFSDQRPSVTTMIAHLRTAADIRNKNIVPFKLPSGSNDSDDAVGGKPKGMQGKKGKKNCSSETHPSTVDEFHDLLLEQNTPLSIDAGHVLIDEIFSIMGIRPQLQTTDITVDSITPSTALAAMVRPWDILYLDDMASNIIQMHYAILDMVSMVSRRWGELPIERRSPRLVYTYIANHVPVGRFFEMFYHQARYMNVYEWQNGQKNTRNMARIIEVFATSMRAKTMIGDETILALYERMNEKAGVFPFANGVYDFDENTHRLPRMNDAISKACAYNMVKSEDIPVEIWNRLHRFLTTILPDRAVLDYLLRVLGRSMTGHREDQAFYVLHGPRAGNGKSTLVKLLETVFGPYVKSIHKGILFGDGRAPDAGRAEPELLALKGTRLAIAPEASADDCWNRNKVKAIVGGDTMTARTLFSKHIVDFTPKCCVVTVCNTLPRVTDDTDSGFARRIRVIGFESKFVSDPKGVCEEQKVYLRDPALAEERMIEMRDCMALLLVNYATRSLAENGGTIRVPPDVVYRNSKYTQDISTMSDYIAENLAFDYDTWSSNDQVNIPYLGTLSCTSTKNGVSRCMPINVMFKDYKVWGIKRGKLDGASSRSRAQSKSEFIERLSESLCVRKSICACKASGSSRTNIKLDLSGKHRCIPGLYLRNRATAGLKSLSTATDGNPVSSTVDALNQHGAANDDTETDALNFEESRFEAAGHIVPFECFMMDEQQGARLDDDVDMENGYGGVVEESWQRSIDDGLNFRNGIPSLSATTNDLDEHGVRAASPIDSGSESD